MTGWHVDEDTLARYARGRGRLSVDASVETHLLSCGRCRARLAPAVELGRLERLWGDVVERVDAPRPGLVERLLRLAGMSENTARLLAATPTLSASWLLAMVVALAFAVAAASASGADERGTLLFLVFAPILPVAGVAAAFHRGLDPAYEIGLAAPYSQFRLLLLRSAAVTAVTCAAALVAGLLLPERGLTAAAWLLPALALTSLTLVLARRVDVVGAAVGIAAVWAVAVVSSQVRVGEFAAFGATGQLACLAVAVVSVVVLVADRDRYATRLGGV
jgi:hypothetical protein